MGALFLQGLLLGFSATASPGPFQAYAISRTLQIGWRAALPIALAPLISDGPILVLVFLALTRVPTDWLQGIQLLGGAFMLWLAWKAWQTYRNFSTDIPAAATTQSLWQAALVNAASPGPYLFWGLFAGPTVIQAWGVNPAWGIAYMVGFYLAIVSGNAGLVLLIGLAGSIAGRARRSLIGVSAVLLAGFGLWQILQGVIALVELLRASQRGF